jgi:hypothetical protein
MMCSTAARDSMPWTRPRNRIIYGYGYSLEYV